MRKLLITNAVIWAVVILVSSYLFKEHENYAYLMGLLGIGFVLQNGFTYNYLKSKAK